jgi:serine protease
MGNLTVTMSGGTGDADMYVREGSQPTTSSYDCRPYRNGNNETCTFSNPGAGTWHISIRGYSAYSGVSLLAEWE